MKTMHEGLKTELSCGSYGPGHMLHWTHWKKAAVADCVPVSQVVQDGTSIELVLDNGPTLTWSHHDPARLKAALMLAREPVLACPQWRALRVDGFWFNCGPEGSTFACCRGDHGAEVSGTDTRRLVVA